MKSASSMGKHLQEAADLMRKLSNSNRLLIVCKLVEGELSVSELEMSLGIKQPVLSQQLAELREAGIVEPRREAKSVYYSLSDPQTTRLISALYAIFCAPNSALPVAAKVEKLTRPLQAAVFARVLADEKLRRR